MATKKTTAAPSVFTVLYGIVQVVFPATYKPDPRRATFTDVEYSNLTRSRDPYRVIAALEQIADVVEADPALATLPPGYTPARLREIATQTRTITEAQADLQAALNELGLLAQLDRDVAADAINDVLATFKVSARRNPTIKDRFALLFNLHKR